MIVIPETAAGRSQDCDGVKVFCKTHRPACIRSPSSFRYMSMSQEAVGGAYIGCNVLSNRLLVFTLVELSIL